MSAKTATTSAIPMPDPSKVSEPMKNWNIEWRRRIMSGAQAIETVTTEAGTTLEMIRRAARQLSMPVILWDIANGMRHLPHDRSVSDGDDALAFDFKGWNIAEKINALAKPRDDEHPNALGSENLVDPVAAMKAVTMLELPKFKSSRSAVFVFMNYYEWFASPNQIETRDVFSNHLANLRLNFTLPEADGTLGTTNRRPIHFVQWPVAGDSSKLDTVRHLVTRMPLPPATAEEIYNSVLPSIILSVKANEADAIKKGKTPPPSHYEDPEYLMAVASAARGVERHKAVEFIGYAVSKFNGLTKGLVPEVRRAVTAQVAASSTATIVPDEDIIPPSSLGGLDNLYKSLRRHARTFTPKARAVALDQALGVWFCGVPGTGKSAGAKAAASIFRAETGDAWTLIRVDIAALYSKYVGETEQNWIAIEQLVQSMGKTILWVDELDKAFGGAMGGSDTSEVRSSLLGLFLQFLSDPRKRADTFVILSMNRVANVPGELLRAGRLNGGYFYDLPQPAVRRQVLDIHFARRLKEAGIPVGDLKIGDDKWAEIVEATTDWIPSELEDLVAESRDLAYENGEPRALPTAADILSVIRSRGGSVYAKMNEEQLLDLRRGCRHARRVDVDVTVAESAKASDLVEKPRMAPVAAIQVVSDAD